MFEHALEIPAPPATVWRLTTDVERWPQITPTTITTVERLDDGPLRVGSTARIKQPGQKATVWTVDEVVEPSRFVWHADVYGMTMTATHQIEPTEAGCRNVLRLDVSGRGAGIMRRLLGRKLRSVLATENDCFSRAATAVDA